MVSKETEILFAMGKTAVRKRAKNFAPSPMPKIDIEIGINTNFGRFKIKFTAIKTVLFLCASNPNKKPIKIAGMRDRNILKKLINICKNINNNPNRTNLLRF